MEVVSRKKQYNTNKLHKRLRRLVGSAIADFNMIEAGDRVMVCLSGGKDSYALLDILRNLQAHAPLQFELIAVNLDQKQPGFPEHVLPEYLTDIGIPFHIVEQDTYSVVKRVIAEGKTTCSLCSRLRRGVLYRIASELGATKIALGHHRDDILETLFLNLFYGGPCNLCGSQKNLQRQAVKEMLQQWERKFPGRLETMFTALQNVQPSHLADTSLYNFRGLKAEGKPIVDGDMAFDQEIFSPETAEILNIRNALNL